ncbi:hypothetical protein AB5I83_14150 [Mesobacillus sp. LC4]
MDENWLGAGAGLRCKSALDALFYFAIREKGIKIPSAGIKFDLTGIKVLE